MMYRQIVLLTCTSIILLSTMFSLSVIASVSGQLDEYSLTVNVVGSGSVSKTPDQATYTYGTVVTLTAVADVGWTFSSWSGDLTGSTSPDTITMDGDKTVTATFTDVTSPITADDYDGLWHTSAFTINLNAVDNIPGSGVAETYYKINDGPIQSIGDDGQPRISMESANNILTYWSVDNAANEELPNILTGIKLDETLPTGSITINNGDAYTTSTQVTLTLNATDEGSGVYQARFSDDNILWKPWEAHTVSKDWTLAAGDGTKTVYHQIKDNAGLVSPTYLDTIILDTAPPTGSITIAGGAAYTNSTSVTLTLFAEDTAQMRFSNDGLDWSSWELYGPSKSWTLSTGDDTKTVSGQFMDNAGLISQDEDTIILDTTQPTANAGSDQTVNEDTSMTFDGSASTDTIGITSYTWTFVDGTLQTLTGTNPTYMFTTPGSYTVTLDVTDPVLHSAADTVVITVLDVTKPVADAGDDQVVHEDTLVTFNGSGSTDNVHITSYIWTFIDTSPQTLFDVSATYIFDEPGVYNVTLTISDAQGNSATDIVMITVVDSTWPAANAGPDQVVEEDTLVALNGSASSDNVGIITYVWTFTDGTPQTMFGMSPSYLFETPGVYAVTLNVTDAEGHFTTDTVMITVQDITPPLIDIGSYGTIVENVPVNLDASRSIDNVAIVDYLWNFGDGTSENSSIPSVVHTYTKPGVYVIALTIADNAGNVDSTSTSIVVYRDTDGDLIADHVDTDDDNDGMPDDWEILNRLNPLDPSDATFDFDGDGLSNLTECQLNSNPNDYTSPSPIPLVDVLVIAIIGFIIFLGILFMRKL